MQQGGTAKEQEKIPHAKFANAKKNRKKSEAGLTRDVGRFGRGSLRVIFSEDGSRVRSPYRSESRDGSPCTSRNIPHHAPTEAKNPA